MADEQILRIIQILYYIIITIILLATVFPVKAYFYPSPNIGNVIEEIQLPNKMKFKKCIIGFVAIMLALNLFLKQSTVGFSHLIVIILILRIVLFSFLPEKICENGILTRNGFITWKMIRKIIPHENNANELELIFKKQRLNGTNRYTLYSSSPISHVEHLINSNLAN